MLENLDPKIGLGRPREPNSLTSKMAMNSSYTIHTAPFKSDEDHRQRDGLTLGPRGTMPPAQCSPLFFSNIIFVI